ncbi:MAG: Crp/Fnr family transcriptional regulator [Erysipelotrichaceae bacterium]|nr:Crp/Fnr family transcriptional regulator [Erysipelotrichaceae bacterium]MDY5251295.1 Crp/Fnr family transcriptional regulator [Erysipelotrichaceae bacterium]
MDRSEVVHNIYKSLAQNNEIKVKTFRKEEIITNFLTNRNYIYFVLSGSCSLYRYTRNGDMVFLQRYERYDSFGDCFHNIELNSELSVVANNKVSVFYFDYDEIIADERYVHLRPVLCEACILQLRKLNERVEILAKKTIRDRILAYFDILSKRSIIKEFELPMSYTQLSAFLGVDRSAMMRELKQLEEDRIIIRAKHRIQINK